MHSKEVANKKIEKILSESKVQSFADLRQKLPEIFEVILNQKTNATLLKHPEHSRFLAPIDEMVEALGLTKHPSVYVVDNIPGIPGAFRKLPNAAGNPILGQILLNTSIMDLTKSNIRQAPAAGLKGAIAHELSHIKYDRANTLLTHFGPFLAPAAGMAGLWLYNQAHKDVEGKEITIDDVKNINKNIEIQAQQEIVQIDQQVEKKDQWQVDPAWQKALVTVGKYLAVGAASYAGALLIARHVSLNREFAADKLAVELTGEPEAFKQMLTDLHKKATSLRKEVPEAENFNEAFKRTYDKLQGMTNHAHPKLTERLAAIDSYAEKIGLENAAASTAAALR